MSEDDVDSVLDRVTAEVNEIEFFGSVNRARVGIILDHLRPGDRLPGGLVVVPEEPSEAMSLAGNRETCDAIECTCDEDYVYRAMLAAASEDKP